MNHRLAQIFRACLTTRLAKRRLMSRTVMIENHRMVHGDVRGALLKVAHGVATRSHHITQQLVGLRYGAARSVHESSLHSGPRLNESRAIGRSERPNVQAFHTLSPLIE